MCSARLRDVANSMFKSEERLTYFDKFLPFFTQSKIFKISYMSKYIVFCKCIDSTYTSLGGLTESYLMISIYADFGSLMESHLNR